MNRILSLGPPRQEIPTASGINRREGQASVILVRRLMIGTKRSPLAAKKRPERTAATPSPLAKGESIVKEPATVSAPGGAETSCATGDPTSSTSGGGRGRRRRG